MNNVKRMRREHAYLLAKLRVDQKFYNNVLKDYDEDGLRTLLAKLRGDLQKEQEKIQAKMKLEKRKDDKPTSVELKKFSVIKQEVGAVERKLTEFNDYNSSKERGSKLIKDIVGLLEATDSVTSSERRELNNL